MNDSPLEIAKRWLAVLVTQDYSAWPAIVADDVRMHFRFSPPGIPGECAGRTHCAAMTARSEARLKNAREYANKYCFLLRFRSGRLSEYPEYFNPLPVLAAFT